MKRELLCRKCVDKFKPGVTPVKTDRGFFRRSTLGITKQPEPHLREITIHTENKSETKQLPLSNYDCDACGKPVGPGVESIAITTWNSEREDEPPMWEEEYLITDPTVIRVVAELQKGNA